MEVQTRRNRTALIQDQENIYANKKVVVVPSKRQGLTVRGALGELNTNIQLNREVNIGKVAVTAAEYEKKASINRNAVNKSHVQSKIDTGLAAKNIVQPSSRPPLRREESTAGLAARAVVRTRAALKDTQAKPNELKESINLLLQTKKNEVKKTTKLPTLKENKEKKRLPKPILKESTGKLGKLKISENTDSCEKLQKDILSEVTNVNTPELPDDIEDIDASDYNSPLLMSIYIKDIYYYLTQLEEKYPIEEDYLKFQTVITGKMRATLIDWLVEVQRQFKLVLETFHLTVGIIDRYLQVVPNVQRNQLQLVGVTAMFIASKYEEIYAPDVGDFVYVTDNAYTKADIFQCEKDIITKLGFCFARPIPLSFLRRFVKAARGTSKNHHLAKYFVDLCLVEYSMAHYHPSHLAASAICLSLYLLSGKPLSEVWSPTLSFYSGYSLENIEPVMRKIAQIVINVEKSKHKAVYNKYTDPTLAKVSTLPQLKGEAIFELANSESLT
ncbi:G2/mitotic-specific cyclin-B2 isoform X2 [Aricia agestis]|uniref:G2/mitotic-specific cyclin-B2 isoform X2 n=1 Tax=Aricia agestis TaxID=91739 RepID=UPI001C202FF7|nr:G2/mitotic-specific cyclin-B2 isoform X2 [Aricia agestis]